jgi:hypothetical protein
MTQLPKPDCELGYPHYQVETLLTGPRLTAFKNFMRGQTMSICDGRSYNYASSEYEDTGCGPHGGVVYESDLKSFVNGRGLWD